MTTIILRVVRYGDGLHVEKTEGSSLGPVSQALSDEIVTKLHSECEDCQKCSIGRIKGYGAIASETGLVRITSGSNSGGCNLPGKEISL